MHGEGTIGVREGQIASDNAKSGAPSPVLIVVMGLPASGKTTLAGALADRLGLVHLSSDVIRKELVGMSLTERPTDASRPEVYSAEMSRRTYLTLRRRAARWYGRVHPS